MKTHNQNEWSVRNQIGYTSFRQDSYLKFICKLFLSQRSSFKLLAWGARGPEIGYLLLPSRDMAEIPLKRCKSSTQPTNQQSTILPTVICDISECWTYNLSFVTDRLTGRQTDGRIYGQTRRHKQMNDLHKTHLNRNIYFPRIGAIKGFPTSRKYCISMMLHPSRKDAGQGGTSNWSPDQWSLPCGWIGPWSNVPNTRVIRFLWLPAITVMRWIK